MNGTIAPRRRAAAVLALVGAVAEIAVAIAIALSLLPEGLLLPLALVVAAAAGWFGLRRRGAARAAGLGLAALALVGALTILVLNDQLLPIGLLVGIAAITAGAREIAFGADRGSLRAAALQQPAAPPAQHPVLLLNPRSGDGAATRVGLAEAARKRGIEVVELQPGADLKRLAKAAIEGGADVIGMAGGDGSLAIVAEIAAHHDIPFVCVPAGTRNHFALDVGVDREQVVKALDAFHDGTERRIDLAQVNGRTFVNNVSLGLYARIVQEDGYREAKLRTAFELLPELIGPDAEPFELRFRDPDGAPCDTALLLMVSNNPYAVGRMRGAGSRPRLDSGELGVVAALPGERGTPSMRDWTAATFDVDADEPVSAGIDGEAVTLDPPLRFATRPGALRVRTSRAHPGRTPAHAPPRTRIDNEVRSLLRIVAGRA